jgi:hypothetical protein
MRGEVLRQGNAFSPGSGGASSSLRRAKPNVERQTLNAER